MHTPTTTVTLCSVLLRGVVPRSTWGHAFPERSVPPVGTTVAVAPPQVRLWCDAAFEAVLSRLQVQTVRGQRLDTNEAHVDPTDAMLLEVSLPPLPPGTSRVLWSVVARDGHRTDGAYTFTIHQGH